MGRSLVVVGLLMFGVGVAPALGLWWLWRRTGRPADRLGMALALLALAVGVAAMLVIGPSVGFRPRPYTYFPLAVVVLMGSWKELDRDSRRVSATERDAAAEDAEADRLWGDGPR